MQVRPGVASALPAGHWGRYVQTVVDRLAANFGTLRPARVAVGSDLALASGMSSSSALVVGCALALADLNGLPDTAAWRAAINDRIDLAGYLSSVENGSRFRDFAGRPGVGTRGGSLDHTAMLTGEQGMLSQLNFSPLQLVRRVPMSPGRTFVVAVSGVRAEKTGAALEQYNRAAEAVAELLGRWRDATGRSDATLAAAMRSAADAPDRLRRLVADEAVLTRRLEHFLAESERIVPDATQALADGDAASFTALADESQRLADELLGNQVPQTISLARSARALGADAAAAFGAGFGGSVWAAVPIGDAEAFAADWLSRYRQEFPAQTEASMIITRPAAAARPVNDAVAVG